MLILNKWFKSRMWLLGVCLFLPAFALSQKLASDTLVFENRASISCYFSYPQGRSSIHPDLGVNPTELARLSRFITETLSIRSFTIRRIRLTGYCSIEGTYQLNSQLARDRVEGFRDYLSQTYPQLYRYPVNLAWVSEDWGTLQRLLEHSDIPEKQKAVRIIRGTPNLIARKKGLQQLNNGQTYREISNRLFPLLRRVEITVEYDDTPISASYADGRGGSTDSIWAPDPMIYSVLDKSDSGKIYEVAHVTGIDYTSGDETVVTFTTPSLKKEQGSVSVHRPEGSLPSDYRGGLEFSRWAVKTNLLYWAGVRPDLKVTTFVPNLSVEYFLSSRWSVEAGARYGNWHYGRHNERFQGISGYRLEGRYWAAWQERLFTSYLGVYGRFGDYNRQVTYNCTGKYWDTGLSAGLYLRLSRHWGIEAGARAGYVRTRATVYNLHNGHRCFDHYVDYGSIRVMDLNVSLVYRW